MNTVSLTAIRPLGKLGYRCSLSALRLEGCDYRPDTVFDVPEAQWPGDREGRALLGQVLICQATGKEPAFAESILEDLDRHVNSKGFLGLVPENGEYNEQQFSGHSWLLRGLCEYYEAYSDSRALRHIRNIMDALFLPSIDGYRKYPITSEGHVTGGAEAGTLAADIDGWHISTDTGCAFIALDGVSHAYHVLKDPAIAELLNVMAERFLMMDPAGMKLQTHATLTACRGLLRYAEDSSRTDLLEAVRHIFRLYCEEGMTADYSNYNWFGRPAWTEPCAVIDSYILAMQLYAAIEAPEYLSIARRICLNGLFRGQRSNGGFGTDTCCGPSEGSGNKLGCSIYEASWCCTMRGGEGLARVVQYSALSAGNTVLLTQLLPCRGQIRLKKGTMSFTLLSDYPAKGSMKLTVQDCPEGSTLSLALPDYVHTATVNGQSVNVPQQRLLLYPVPGSSYRIGFDIPLTCENAYGRHNSGTLILHGDRILGADRDTVGELTEAGDEIFTDGTATLVPTGETGLLSKADVEANVYTVLF